MLSNQSNEGGGALLVGEHDSPCRTYAATESGQTLCSGAPSLVAGAAATPGLARLCADIDTDNSVSISAYEILYELVRDGSWAAIDRWLSVNDSYILEGPDAVNTDGCLCPALTVAATFFSAGHTCMTCLPESGLASHQNTEGLKASLSSHYLHRPV